MKRSSGAACAVATDQRRPIDMLVALLLSILVGLSAAVTVGLPAGASGAALIESGSAPSYDYDYRPDTERAPPAEVARFGYDTATNFADPAGHLGRVLRARSSHEVQRSAPNGTTRHVIGGMEDLGPGSLRAGEATVASRLPGDAGNRLGNWLNNRDVLRSVMREGRPIRDASVDSAGNLLYQDTRRFITLERDFLRSSGWRYDPSTQLWMPPG